LLAHKAKQSKGSLDEGAGRSLSEIGKCPEELSKEYVWAWT